MSADYSENLAQFKELVKAKFDGTTFAEGKGLLPRYPTEQFQLRDAGVSDRDVLKQAALDVKEKNAGNFTEEQKSALFIFQARLHKLETGEAKRQELLKQKRELLNKRDPKAVTGNEKAELRKIQNNLYTVNAQLKRFDEELLKVER